jgi:hypothetical protein
MVAEPPSNGEYLIAAYIVTTVVLAGYWLRLWRMAAKTVSGERENQQRERGQKGVSGKREKQ